MKTLAASMLLLLTVIVAACDEPFTPKGTFEHKVAVFAILSTNTDTQYVRLFRSFDPPGFNPDETTQGRMISAATVTVAQDNQRVLYGESTLPRSDMSSFAGPMVAYTAPFRPQGGKSYNLLVNTVTDGSMNATITVPDTGWVRCLNPWALSVMRVLYDRTRSEDISIQANISSGARGYMVQFFLEFSILTGSEWVEMRMEIPNVVYAVDSLKASYGYPILMRRSTYPGLPHEHQIQGATFSFTAYRQKLTDLKNAYKNNIWFRRAIFIQTQVEENLYNYYNIANGFQDPRSVRLDTPDWTNINGGLGIFGAIVQDSVSVESID
jgi:hypothetical protein